VVAVDQTREDMRSFQVGEIIRHTVTSLTPKLKKTRVTVDIRGDAMIEMYGNPGALSQIITNLVINSLIHGYGNRHDVAGHILIELVREPSTVTIRYRDDGAGIAPEHLDQVFKQFFTTNREHGGSGLGLYLVHNIVTKTMNGSIALASEPGKGVCFTMVFPVS
jgi:signal transduction histidine kinase